MPFLLVVAGVIGACVGSFVNVVAYRVPAGMSLSRPGSACPKCEHPIRARHNVPVLGWLVLRGKCHDCAEPISGRYPLVEAATAAVFVAVAWVSGLSAATPFLLWAAGAGVALFLIDLDTFRLPDKVSVHVFGAALAAVAAKAAEVAAVGGPVGQVLGTAFASGGVWLGLYLLPWLVTRGRGMGFGDVKLAPSLGLVLGLFGWGASLTGWAAGILLGMVYGLTLMLTRRATGKSAIPFGPFILAGALVGLLAGEPVFGWYLSLFGL